VKFKFVICLLAVVALAACSNNRAALKPAELRKPAPPFQLKDAEGRPVSLADYKDKVVLVNFWATWCNPCRVEIPWFADFERQYKDQGFAVLGISLDEHGWKDINPFVDEYKLNYKVLLGTEELSNLYGVEALPMTYMIDREGRLAAIHRGLMRKATYEDEIKGLLNAPAHAAASMGSGALLALRAGN